MDRIEMGWAYLDDVEQFYEDGGDAAEESRSARTLHLMTVPQHLDERTLL